MRKDSLFLTVDSSIFIANSYLVKSTYNCCSMLFCMSLILDVSFLSGIDLSNCFVSILHPFNISAITGFLRFSPIVCGLAGFAIKSEIEYEKLNTFYRLMLSLYNIYVTVVLLFTSPSKYVTPFLDCAGCTFSR